MRLLLSSVLAASWLVTATSAFVQQPQPRTFRSITSRQAEKKKIFIDGEAGTTGLQVRDRLEKRDDIDIISAPNDLRKDEATRKRLINEADAVILCKSEVSQSSCASVCVRVVQRTVKLASHRIDQSINPPF